MNAKYRTTYVVERAITILFLIASCALPMFGQQDLQIMVYGPWSYVKDPNPTWDNNYKGNRIVLVAPTDGQHKAYRWSGPDASMEHFMNGTDHQWPLTPSDNGNQVINLYYLDFDGANPGQEKPPDEEPPLPYPTQGVLDAQINTVLYPPSNAQNRYALSLPMPDYVQTYEGTAQDGYGKGLAEAKIGIGGVTPATPPAPFTTWMVLHYSVSTVPTDMDIAFSILTSIGKLVPDHSQHVDSDGKRSGISLFLGQDPPCRPEDDCFNYSEQECDELSGQSFAETMNLWNLPEYARFPVQLDGAGDQDSWNYDYQMCSAASGADVKKAVVLTQQAKDRNKRILEELRGLKRSLTTLLQLSSARGKLRAKHGQVPTAEVKAIQDQFNSLVEDFRKEFPPGRLPKSLRHALACTAQATKVAHLLFPDSATEKGCPKFPEDVIQVYFQTAGPLWSVGKGSADCHSPQIDINDVLTSLQGQSAKPNAARRPR